MPDLYTVEARGLRALDGRFARASEIAATRRDALLRALAVQARDKLAQAAPRGTGPGQHLADLFTVTPIATQGQTASVTVTNSKQVRGGGKVYNLVDLLTTGTRPHNIPNAFGWGLGAGIGGRFSGLFHPGTRANPFVSKALRGLDVASEGQKVAIKVAGNLVGTEATYDA